MTLLYFLSNIFQGYASHIHQLGLAAQMLRGKPNDIPGSGLETFL